MRLPLDGQGGAVVQLDLTDDETAVLTRLLRATLVNKINLRWLMAPKNSDVLFFQRSYTIT
jgi:hypothetical protein